MAEPTFRSLTDPMQADIIKWADGGWGSRRIVRQLELKYEDPPSRGTVDNFLRRLRQQESPELDDLLKHWSLGAMADPEEKIEWEDAALILKVQHRVTCEIAKDTNSEYSDPFPVMLSQLTVDHARWIARLGRMFPGADPLDLYRAAVKYRDAERLGHVRGKKLSTGFLDSAIDPDSERPFEALEDPNVVVLLTERLAKNIDATITPDIPGIAEELVFGTGRVTAEQLAKLADQFFDVWGQKKPWANDAELLESAAQALASPELEKE